MLRGIVVAVATIFAAAVGALSAHAQTKICNGGNVPVHVALAYDARFTVVVGWFELKPGACEQRTGGYWVAVRQTDKQGRLGIADYRPDFGQRPVFYGNMGRGFCVHPTQGFSNSQQNVETCAAGQEKVQFTAYANDKGGGLLTPSWSIPTKPDAPVSVFGSGSGLLDPRKQGPQLDPGDKLAFDIITSAAGALLKGTLPNINFDKYNTKPSGPAPWSQIEADARSRAKTPECLALHKSFHHCNNRFPLDDDGYRHVPCDTRLHLYRLCQDGKSEQLKSELATYSQREKEPQKITPIVRQTDKAVTWEFGKVPPNFHPKLSEAEASSGGKRIKMYTGRDPSSNDDHVLVMIHLFKFKRDEWDVGAYPPMPQPRRNIISEDRTAVEGSLILECDYLNPATQRRGIRYYWYKQKPAAADPGRLKERLSDHPLLEFGGPREDCPIKFDPASAGWVRSLHFRSDL